MTWLPLALVLSSGLAHAAWNLLLKRSHNQEVFAWLLLIAQVVLFAPLAVFLISIGGIQTQGWWFILGTSLIHVFYFLFLSRSYIHTDLSLAYPIARGTGPALVPLIGVIALGENITDLAIIGIMSIVGGIFTAYWGRQILLITREPSKLLKDPGTKYALLTGLTITAYSIWDKIGVSYVTPMLYMYLLSLGASTGLAPYILLRHEVKGIQKELQFNLARILVAAVLAFFAYAAVLMALRLSNVSYVAPAREIGIVFSVLLGGIVLKESFSKERVIGAIAITIGVFLIAIG
ncbi:MAG: hypothetical protein FI734_03745 [SAR202 cluster bacterium]|mgnify:CR=1 FL=1|nr:hypothetical protein [SAR202 cluster bacterium]|tara:strand:- start:226 stop:1098 length:873 start_codon:yes stop_codon:yes gene_type:complete